MGAKALVAPVGLATVAALLPRQWNLRIVDLNVRPIADDDWNWTELVMVSGMIVQKNSLLDVVREAKARRKTVVVGGPYATSVPEPVLEAGADYVIRGEGENLVPEFLEALKNGNTRRVFESSEKPQMTTSPVPHFDLLRAGDYAAMSIQTSRGCPYDCEFCDIVSLFGRKMRCKTADQVLEELEALHRIGWRGTVFISDDNFIGNKIHARALLNKLILWMESRGYPFDFWTQASVDLGGDLEMIDLMTAANFSHVFIGVESPDEAVLELNDKHQNIRHPLLESLRAINNNGLTVIASFVLGFDNERPGAGRRICEFVQEAGLPLVVLNVLQVLPNTRLWQRLEKEGRLLQNRTSGETTCGRLNYVPTRSESEIMQEFGDAWNYLYDPSRYIARAFRSCLEMRPTRRAMAIARGERPPPQKVATRATWAGKLRTLIQFLKLVVAQGVMPPLSFQFWSQFVEVKKRNPSRIVRYLGQCDTGENMFGLGSEINKRAEAAAEMESSMPLPPPHQTRWIARSGFDNALSRLLSCLYFDLYVLVVRKLHCWRYRGLAANDTLSARAYRPGDERRIIRLFNLVFREGKSLSRWRWEFLQNPYGKVNNTVLENDRVGIVGHYGGLFVPFQYLKQIMPASQTGDVMIHPVFRDKEPFVRLFHAYAKASAENGAKFLYGFTSKLVARLHRHHFGIELAPVSEWVCELRSSQASCEPLWNDLAVSPIDQFGPEADGLWEEIKELLPCATVRDRRYLNWRYSTQSDRKYTRWQVTDLSSGKTVGLAVLTAAGPTGFIMELLASPQDQRIVKALLQWSVAHFAQSAKVCVRAWFSGHGKLRECARASGFMEIRSELVLNLFCLDETINKAVLREKFYYSLGDYDVY